MDKTIRERLFALAEEEFRKFSAALLPNINNVIGVRLPLLRKLAKELAKGDWRGYIAAADSEYFEEAMLQGMVLGYADADIEERLSCMADFIPKIDNWSVCDSFCAGLKFAKENQERVWAFLQPYLVSEKEYEVRFGVVMLLDFYIDEAYVRRVLLLLDGVRHEGYYVKMAVAWAISMCYIKFPDLTMEYLQDNALDDFTYNKALQKITESYRAPAGIKATIRGMKRNKKRKASVPSGVS